MIPKEKLRIDIVNHIKPKIHIKSIFDINFIQEKIYYFGIPEQIGKRIPHTHLVSLRTNKTVCSDKVKIDKEISMVDIKDEYGGKYKLCKNCMKFYNNLEK